MHKMGISSFFTLWHQLCDYNPCHLPLCKVNMPTLHWPRFKAELNTCTQMRGAAEESVNAEVKAQTVISLFSRAVFSECPKKPDQSRAQPVKFSKQSCSLRNSKPFFKYIMSATKSWVTTSSDNLPPTDWKWSLNQMKHFSKKSHFVLWI